MKTLLWLSVASTLVVLSVSVTAEQKLKNCNEVRAAYSSKGFNVNDVPNKGVNGEFWKKKKPTLFYWTFYVKKQKKSFHLSVNCDRELMVSNVRVRDHFVFRVGVLLRSNWS